MKKKFLLAAVLVGALSLGSCVDDKESPSVTDVRTAKAEQLRSVAELNKATAEATTVRAQAEAAANNALADYRKAQAELEKAKVAMQNAETEAKKAELEAVIAKAAADKAKAEAELQTCQAQLEADLMRIQNQLLSYKQQYLNSLKNLSDIEKSQFEALMQSYTLECGKLVTAQKELANAQKALRETEAGLTGVQEAKDELILQKKEEISDLEKEIATWQAQIEVYEKYATPAEAEAALEAAKTKLTDLEQQRNVASTTWNNTWRAVPTAVIKITPSDEQVWNGSEYVYGKSQFATLLKENFAEGTTLYNITLVADEKDENVGFETTDAKGKTTFTALYTKQQTKRIENKYTLEDGLIPSYAPYDSIKTMYALSADGFKAFFAQATENLKNPENVANAKKEADAAAKALTAANEKVTEIEGAIKTLEGLSETADVADAIADLKAQLTTAKADAATAKTESEAAAKTYKELAEAAEKNVEQLEGTQEIYDELVAEAPTFQKNVAAVNAAREANAEAQKAYYVADFACTEQDAVVKSLTSTWVGDSAKDQVQILEGKIKDNEAKIKEANEEIENLDSIESQEQAIEYAKALVEQRQNELAAQQKLTDAAKKALEDAINATEE